MRAPLEFTVEISITQRWLAGAALALTLLGGAAPSLPANDPPPAYAFPMVVPGTAYQFTDPVTVERSKLRVPKKEMDDSFYEPDWFPQDHPKMPEVVAHGRKPKLWACSYCHLPTGVGDAGSAMLAGLPASYILHELQEFRSGRRRCLGQDGKPCAGDMENEAREISNAEAKEAADYFSSLKPVPRYRVVEAAMVPRSRPSSFYVVRDEKSGTVPLGDRLLELPDDGLAFAKGDWRVGITAYVPPGSIAHGKKLVHSGAGAAPCTTCHGQDFRGTSLAPPLAGRDPAYIVRQLYTIRYGYRSGPALAPMEPEVAHLKPDDRLAIAAYLASLKP